MAPEVVLGVDASAQSDIFSGGRVSLPDALRASRPSGRTNRRRSSIAPAPRDRSRPMCRRRHRGTRRCGRSRGAPPRRFASRSAKEMRDALRNAKANAHANANANAHANALASAKRGPFVDRAGRHDRRRGIGVSAWVAAARMRAAAHARCRFRFLRDPRSLRHRRSRPPTIPWRRLPRASPRPSRVDVCVERRAAC